MERWFGLITQRAIRRGSFSSVKELICKIEPFVAAYDQTKATAQAGIQRGLQQLLGVAPEQWRHGELATPRGFARWTSRPFGFVGGLGQHPSRFGPFGLASRPPLPGLWLCGDSIHPGEGTAAVGLSALMACRQLLAERGQTLSLSGLST